MLILNPEYSRSSSRAAVSRGRCAEKDDMAARHIAYLAATLALEKTPMVITATKPLRVDYGVALWDGRTSAEQVQHAYEAWLKLPRAVQE